ncbi:hypothetical protein D9757_012538 [Collybiopsis confluens]|uniref:Uncharacterized protein n=1 Tax=Collybiopsis confluens TaxID=2823264 RepID=A0A8H5G1R2_9AGAR|nr:hypothetical protein D9757_012538 [Collybiopsis confluens]
MYLKDTMKRVWICKKLASHTGEGSSKLPTLYEEPEEFNREQDDEDDDTITLCEENDRQSAHLRQLESDSDSLGASTTPSQTFSSSAFEPHFPRPNSKFPRMPGFLTGRCRGPTKQRDERGRPGRPLPAVFDEIQLTVPVLF